MVSKNKLKVSLDEIYQTIDLDEFGLNLKSKADRDHLAEAFIEHIQKRTASGVGMSFTSTGAGRPFNLSNVPYSEGYKKSLDFKAFGKKAGKVNMTLSGDMLALIDVLPSTGNTIKIGWDDDLQTKKAFNHITGDTLPRRPFFGVNRTEIREIIAQVKKELEDE
jgi:hypothetical protein